MILDNADDLRLFEVGEKAEGNGVNGTIYKYVPCAVNGAVLWTSRDAHIAGTLVGVRRGIKVQSMAIDEATMLLARAKGDPSAMDEVKDKEEGVDALLEDLQRLPLAISQAGAYMGRMSMTAKEYLPLLRQGKT
ncbi:hypothetical protein B0I35DRAFT_441770 [Stachybotrys elegans]|uniref:Uncharacterized protein n=1 Tax=Stachybotrys elegans TaxID=80388 RepID=A0A8K0SHJ8_9HYPO|nr:hypothetical protein B0I35DRAFT_441770 [Stachybotrys elegans]